MAGLNEALLAKAGSETVAHQPGSRGHYGSPANVAYPTDSGLLAKAIRRMRGPGSGSRPPAARCAQGAGSVAGGRETRAPIAAKLRSRSQLGRDQVKDRVLAKTGELADLASHRG